MIKEGDFVELDYTGRVDGEVFDTSVEEVAKKNGLYNPKVKYGSVKVIVGAGNVLPGIDKALPGKEPGSYSLRIKPEDAFGKKTAELLKMIPVREFEKQGLKPYAGLEVSVDGMPGVVRSVSSGRTIVDFNHPLAGKELEYEVVIKRVITSKKEKLEALLEIAGIPHQGLREEGGVFKVKAGKVPDQFKEAFSKEAEKRIKVKVEFE